MKEIASLGEAVYKITQMIVILVFFLTWLLGFMIAQGWSAVACILPPYAIYVVMEKIITHFGSLSWLLK